RWVFSLGAEVAGLVGVVYMAGPVAGPPIQSSGCCLRGGFGGGFLLFGRGVYVAGPAGGMNGGYERRVFMAGFDGGFSWRVFMAGPISQQPVVVASSNLDSHAEQFCIIAGGRWRAQ
ncbi:hypothetical protein KL941_005428, partial [Ogataea angusta]